MKTLFRASLMGMLAASAFYAQGLSSLNRSACANPGASRQGPARYCVTDLGTFGGDFSIAYGINNAGQVGGAGTLPNGNLHAFLSEWATREQEVEGLDGSVHKTDLGTLGGPNSSASRPDGMGNVPIVSATSTPDPLGEDFCQFHDGMTCLGAVWKGALTPLQTLGGNNAMALLSNNRGQIIGLAENGTHDPGCPSPQFLDFEAVVWGPRPGEIHGLPPLPGDTVGYALGINDRGQVVGSSGSCANTGPTISGLFIGQHAVLWEHGSVRDLGNLGGKMQGKAGAINDRGEVAGFSDLPDGTVVSFLWTKNTGMHELGALGADILGDPAGINNNTQVVGGSCGISTCRAFLWEKNVMSDLNDLAVDSPLYLFYALGINDGGEIVGLGQTSTGEMRAYLATPIRGKSSEQSAMPATQSGTSEKRQPVLPENIRVLLQQRLPFGRLGGRRPGPR